MSYIIRNDGFEHRVLVDNGRMYGHENIPKLIAIQVAYGNCGDHGGWVIEKE